MLPKCTFPDGGLKNISVAKGIQNVISYAKEGVRLWFKTERPVYRQL